METLVKFCYRYANALKKEGIGVAVSGGGDSLALCFALKKADIPFTALHFDHNLRPESSSERDWLKKLFQSEGIPFYSQTWQTPAQEGSLQQSARNARYAFFEQAAHTLGVRHIFTAHTVDDMTESTLMRLFYGSGTQGLAAMAPKIDKESYTLHRPVIHFTRDELRRFLKKQDQTWLEDPSNYKADYVRVRARYLLKNMPDEMASELLRLAHGCAHLEEALAGHLKPYKNYIVQHHNDWAVLNSTLLTLPDYARQRLFKTVFKGLQPKRHPPRPQKQARLFEALGSPEASHSLGHIHFQREGQKIIARPMV